MHKVNLQHLVQQIQHDKDQMSFKKLFELLFPSLLQFAYSLLGDSFLAEEIVNDVFIKFWLQKEKTGTISNIKVYLYVSVKNAVYNQIRGQKNRQKHNQKLEHFYGNFHFNSTPEEIYFGKEAKQTIETALQELPPRCKLIFMMIKEEGLRIQEVSEILNLSYKTVFTQLKIALTKLEKSISRQTDYTL